MSSVSSNSSLAATREKKSTPQQWNLSGKLKRLTTDSTGRAAVFIGLIVALMWAPYLINFHGRDAAERPTFPGSDGLRGLELRSLDARFAARGIALPASADKIAIVGIDQNSLGRIGRWPWPRASHARLIDKLRAAGARVIALDLDFSDRQNPGANGQLSADDRALIQAAARAGNVVLPSLLAPETGASGERTYHLVTPFTADENGNDGLDETTLDLGLAYLPADSDGRFRRYPFALNINGETLGGWAPLSCAIYQGLIDSQNSERYQSALQKGVWPAANGAAIRVPLRATQFLGRDAPRLESTPINFAGPGGTFKTYSYADVLNGYDAANLRAKFGGRIVLVGPTAPVLKDTFAAPPFHSKTREVSADIPGVEIHANAIAMLLDGNYLTPPPPWLSWVCLFGMALGCALWAEKTRHRVSSWGARAAKPVERARAPWPHLRRGLDRALQRRRGATARRVLAPLHVRVSPGPFVDDGDLSPWRGL